MTNVKSFADLDSILIHSIADPEDYFDDRFEEDSPLKPNSKCSTENDVQYEETDVVAEVDEKEENCATEEEVDEDEINGGDEKKHNLSSQPPPLPLSPPATTITTLPPLINQTLSKFSVVHSIIPSTRIRAATSSHSASLTSSSTLFQSRVARVRASDIPGLSTDNPIYNGGAGVVCDGGGGGGDASKDKLVQTLLELLGRAAAVAGAGTASIKESESSSSQCATQAARTTLMRSEARSVTCSLGGLTKRQAMQPHNFTSSQIPDYDPDFEYARALKIEREEFYAHSGTAVSAAVISGGKNDVFHHQPSTDNRQQQQQQQLSQKPITSSSSAAPPSPQNRRATALDGLDATSRDRITDSCEGIYASFLGDLLSSCRKRAEDCHSSEDMAMLRVLSEHVIKSFAATSSLEDIQANMIVAAKTNLTTNVTAKRR